MTRRELFAALIAPLVAVKALASPRKKTALEQYRAGTMQRMEGFTFYEPQSGATSFLYDGDTGEWDGDLSKLDDDSLKLVGKYLEAQCFGSKIKPKEIV